MRKTLIIVAGAAVVAFAGFVVVFIVGWGLFSKEMACSEGEAPANNDDGGSACFKVGSELPPGFTWDPRGNHQINK